MHPITKALIAIKHELDKMFSSKQYSQAQRKDFAIMISMIDTCIMLCNINLENE